MSWNSTFHVSGSVNVNTKIDSILFLALLVSKQSPDETVDTCNNGRFTCPVCRKGSKNARTFNIHLNRHRLSGTSIFNSLPSNSTNFVPAPITEDIPASGTQGSLSVTQDMPYLNNAGANVLATSTSAFLFDDSIFTLDFVRPADDNRLVFMNTDISAKFHEFQLSINRKIDCKEHLTLEENLQHILALSSILLLKSARTHADLHEYVSLNTCNALAAHILISNNFAHHKFPAVTKAEVEQIVEKVAAVVSMVSSMSFLIEEKIG